MQCVLADGSPAEQGMKVTKIENCPDVWADYIESYAIVKHIGSGWVECIFPEPEMDYPLSIESKFLVPYVEPDFNETEFLSLLRKGRSTMDYLLADGSRWEPGLSVASNGMAPENYWAASLMEGHLTDDEPFERGDHYSCWVSFEKLTDENLAGAKIGRVYACRLEHLQATMQHVDYNESESLRLLGGEMHETC